MSELFSTIRLIAALGGVLLLAFMILLALPQSRLKEMVMPFVHWGVAALSVAYVVSPIDIMPEIVLGPFGLVDDLAAVAVAIGSVMTALNANKGQKQIH